MTQVLVVDDDPKHRETLVLMLRRAGHAVSAAGHEADTLARLSGEAVGVLVLVQYEGGIDGLALLERVRRMPRETRPLVIMLSETPRTTGPVDAMKHGAFEHLGPAYRREDLLAAVALATRAMQAARTESTMSRPLPAQERETPRMLIGASAAMRSVQRRIGMAASSNATLLITGETGTGKEMAARLLHRSGPNPAAPFVVIACASLTAEAMRPLSRGAVSGSAAVPRPNPRTSEGEDPGALRARWGLESGGTCYLDEVAETPLALQAEMLPWLDRLQAPDDGQLPGTSGVRIIAASQRDLFQAQSQGAFRADLLYRLDVLRLRMPPLRECRGDITALAHHFLARRAPDRQFSRAALAQLEQHRWPGNVRELEATIERAVVLSRSPLIQPADLELVPVPMTYPGLPAVPASGQGLVAFGMAAGASPGPTPGETTPVVAGRLPDALAALERQLITQALAQTGGNRSRTARLLGINRQLLYSKLQSLGLD